MGAPIPSATRSDLVSSPASPAREATSRASIFLSELALKRLELLRALVPGIKRVAVLVNPVDAANTEPTVKAVEPGARAIGMQIQISNASTSGEIDVAFAGLARDPPDALFVAQTPFFNARRVQLVQLTARYGIPATYPGREFTEIGGLMSYRSNIADAYRQIGVYSGRILKGAKPADLPVVQATKFELIINVQTARMLSLIVPPMLLATTDEVIE